MTKSLIRTNYQVTISPTIIFFACLTIWLLAIFFVQPHLNEFILFYDDGDLFLKNSYFDQSRWVDTQLIPYKDYVVEYPPIGLYWYSLPRFLVNVYGETDFLYGFVFISLLAVLGIYFLLQKYQPQYVLFLCTPTFFYFGFCRFDAFPALVSLLAVILVLRKKHYWGGAVLALAIGIKWYPVVLILPLLAVVENKVKWLMLVGSLGFIFCFHNIYYAGIDGALSTYLFHTGRIFNTESLLYLINKYLLASGNLQALMNSFSLLQFLPSVLVALFLWLKKPELSKQTLALSAIICILSFILFAKFNSPQWLIWVIPFVILSADKEIVWSYFALDVMNYITVPLAFRIVDDATETFDIFNTLRIVLVIWLLGLAIWKLSREREIMPS